MFAYPRHPPPAPTLARRSIEVKPPEQDVLDKNFFRAFNMEERTQVLKNDADSTKESGELSDVSIIRPLSSLGIRKKGAAPTQMHTDDPNLIDMGIDLPSVELLSGNVFELFDPLKQSDRPHSWPTRLHPVEPTSTPPFVTPSNDVPPPLVNASDTSSFSFPFPVKLRLKLTTFPEIKPFSQLVQQIRMENQTKQVETRCP